MLRAVCPNFLRTALHSAACTVHLVILRVPNCIVLRCLYCILTYLRVYSAVLVCMVCTDCALSCLYSSVYCSAACTALFSE